MEGTYKTTKQVSLVAEVDDRVWVLNYRCRPGKWETGVVRDVEAGFNKDRIGVTYTVILDRKTTNRWGWETCLRLYVGEDKIRLIANI